MSRADQRNDADEDQHDLGSSSNPNAMNRIGSTASGGTIDDEGEERPERSRRHRAAVPCCMPSARPTARRSRRRARAAAGSPSVSLHRMILAGCAGRAPKSDPLDGLEHPLGSDGSSLSLRILRKPHCDAQQVDDRQARRTAAPRARRPRHGCAGGRWSAHDGAPRSSGYSLPSAAMLHVVGGEAQFHVLGDRRATAVGERDADASSFLARWPKSPCRS